MPSKRAPVTQGVTEQEAVIQEQEEQQTGDTGQHKGGRQLKQVAFAIGTSREQKLDDLAYQYNRHKGTRIGRNDIVRYLIDELTLEDLLAIDLLQYKK